MRPKLSSIFTIMSASHSIAFRSNGVPEAAVEQPFFAASVRFGACAHCLRMGLTQPVYIMSNALPRAACTVLFAILASPALAGTVSGVFTTKGEQFKPAHVTAFRTGDDTTVMLSANALDGKSIAKSSDPYFSAINDPAVHGLDFITFTVNGKGIVQMNATLDQVQNIDSSGSLFGTQGSLVANCTANTKEHVACHVSSAGNPKWTLDNTFDSTVFSSAGS